MYIYPVYIHIHTPYICVYTPYIYIYMYIYVYIQGRFNNQTVYSLYRIMVMATSVMGVMKMEDIVPRVGIEPISLPVQASVLITTPPRLPVDTILPMSTPITIFIPIQGRRE